MLNTLKNWAREGGPGPQDPPSAPAPVKAKVEPPKEEPPPRLMPSEVAELVARCQSRKPVESRFARIELAKALAKGAIAAELVATIPAELVHPPKPRAP